MNLYEDVSSELISETIDSVTDSSENIVSWDWNEIWANIVNWCKVDGLRFLIAIVVVIILFIIINGVAKGVRATMRKSGKDETISNAVYSILRKSLKVVVLILFFTYIGLDMTGISSIIASIAVALGLALQGSLSNVAGWFIIILVRPFKLGDFINAQDESGTVEDINLFYTHLKTPDNKVVLIPNGNITSGNIINYSRKDIRRIDLVFSISYSDDANVAIEAIKEVVAQNELIFHEPEPFVKVSGYAASSVDITVRVWAKSSDYWTIHFELMSTIRKALEEKGCTIPFNQLDVNVNYLDNKKDEK